jgi:hypothetical protein
MFFDSILSKHDHFVISCLFTETFMKVGLKSANMIIQEITVNGKKFRLTMTDQLLMDVRRLKALYNAAYEDPESFEEVSSAISNTINQIATAVEPPVSDGDLDGLIQSIMKAVDEKAKESEEAKTKHVEDSTKPVKKATKPAPKSTKKSKK